MTICFVIPPSAFLLDERVFVSLGVLKVAAACEARKHRVEVMDLSGVENYEEVATIRARQTSSQVVYAFTATTPQMPAAWKIAKAIRQADPFGKLILGGPHITLAAAASKKGSVRGEAAVKQCLDVFDLLVFGDGEDAIEEAIRALPMTPARYGDKKTNGVVAIDADDPKRGGLFLTAKRLAEIPEPARHLVDLESYHYTIDGERATSLVAQLGCPFGCAFCGGRASPMLRRARMRPTEQVLAEIERLHVEHGYRGFMLYDDELNVNPKLVELMQGITALQRKHGAEFRLRGFVKAELFTKEQAEAMREAGFRWLLCGFESGSPRILDNINKRATVEDNDRCVELARAAGLKVKALMSIGHAGESPATIDETRAWLLRVRPDDFDCTIITPYPGSPYYDEAKRLAVIAAFGPPHSGRPVWTYTAPRTGDRLHQIEVDYATTADYYKGSPGGGYRAYVFTDSILPDGLVVKRDELENVVRAELRIPFNPSAAARRYEHSMGQHGTLPPSILRTSEPAVLP